MSRMCSMGTDNSNVQIGFCIPNLSGTLVMACLKQNLITYFLSNIFNKTYDVRGLYVRPKHVIALECNPR